MTRRTLIKFIYDDRDSANKGWIYREYLGNEMINEVVMGDDLDPTSDIHTLKQNEFPDDHSGRHSYEVYYSMSDSQPADTL